MSKFSHDAAELIKDLDYIPEGTVLVQTSVPETFSTCSSIKFVRMFKSVITRSNSKLGYIWSEIR